VTNPLLAEWDRPFGIPPFDTFNDDDFSAAVDTALDAARTEVLRIAEADEAPTFANTIEALELADETLGKVLGVFFTLAGTDTNEARNALMREFSPKLSAYGSEVTMNAALFKRIETLWAARDMLDLTQEQRRVLFLTRRGFLRAGAALEGEARDRLTDVKTRLSVLGTEFTQNLLKDEASWFMPLEDTEGLPGFLLDAATAAGEEKGADRPVVTLSRSLIVPFLQFSPNREARKAAWTAWTSRGANGGETDNRAIAAEILKLREERARLLGYDSFAEYKLETEMAGSPARVRDLLMQVWRPAKAQAEADAAKLEEMLVADGFDGPLEPWDWRYYSEQRRRAEHDLDEAELKPYLQLDRMIEAAFACAGRLFGLEFTPIDADLHHPDARAWDITRDGRHMAVFVGDYFARSSKRSGAWCSSMRSQRKLGGEVRPIVLNVCNFAKPAEGRPALLSYDDARTLFHEFGHGLHGLLTTIDYTEFSGVDGPRDYTEFPAQILEHWASQPQLLNEYALHYETGEVIPQELVDRMLEASTFNQGFKTTEFIAASLLDMAWHTLSYEEAMAITDARAFEVEVLEGYGLIPEIEPRYRTQYFLHSSGGYSAGYYAYLWSEILDADGFYAFKETGDIYDPELAARLKKWVYESGGLKPADELYRLFRGKDPIIDPLLEVRGFKEAEGEG